MTLWVKVARIDLSMEKFLAFWSHNNTVIIEVLVALILFSTIYLVYRTFFGSRAGEAADGVAGPVVNTVQIEKTLQKILEQQASSHSNGSGKSDEGSRGEESLELVTQLAATKKALEEKEKQIVVLQEKAAAAVKAAQAASPSPNADAIAAAAEAAAGLAEKERSDYDAKIKELESRLAEYEIISEDIADLSFFKEENARLTKELEGLRGGGTASAPESLVEAAPTPVEAPATPTAAEAPTSAEAPEPPVEAIDDSLLAEFAQAVEGQKSGTEEAPAKKNENDQLLAEFENFNKKS